MQVLIYSDNYDFVRVIGLLSDDIHKSIDVREVTDCQLINAALKGLNNLLVIDDRKYKFLNEECFSVFEKNKIPLIIILKKRENIKRYLHLNVLGYYQIPLDWHAIKVKLSEFYSNNHVLNSKIGHSTNEKLIVRCIGEIYAIPYTSILFMEKKEKSVFIHTQDKVYECHDSLKHIHEKLPQAFIRVHSSYIVNFDLADHIEESRNRTYHIHFNDYPEQALMSRKKSEEIMQDAINHYRLSFIEK